MIHKIKELGYDHVVDERESSVPEFLQNDLNKILLSGFYHGGMTFETEYDLNRDIVKLKIYDVWQKSCCDPHDSSGNFRTLSALLFSKKDLSCAYIWRPDVAMFFGSGSRERFWSSSDKIKRDIDEGEGSLVDRVYNAVKGYDCNNVVELRK